MTNHEAVELLKTHNEKCSGCDKLCDDMCKPAVELAIQALEKQIPKFQMFTATAIQTVRLSMICTLVRIVAKTMRLTMTITTTARNAVSTWIRAVRFLNDWRVDRMSMLSEQVKELRETAEYFEEGDDGRRMLLQAADTIEALSAKLAKENMERSERYYNGGWILCSERLPTESGEYNVTDECGISTTLYYEKENNRWVDIVEHYSIYYPSAWQPLPEPYKPQ